MNAPRTSDANQRLLRRFLSRYINFKKARKRLEERIAEIEKDFSVSPLRAINTCSGGGGSAGSTVPPYVLALDSILSEIISLKNESADAMREILSVINLLDHDGLKYTSLSLRYIDGWNEEQICEYIPCARATYYRLIEDGIDELLLMPEVRSRMNRFAIEVTKIPKTFKVDT